MYSLHVDTIKELINTANSLCHSSNNDSIDRQSLAYKHSCDYPYFVLKGLRSVKDLFGLTNYLHLRCQWIFNTFLVRVPTLNTQWYLSDCFKCFYIVYQWITINYTKVYIKKMSKTCPAAPNSYKATSASLYGYFWLGCVWTFTPFP